MRLTFASATLFALAATATLSASFPITESSVYPRSDVPSRSLPDTIENMNELRKRIGGAGESNADGGPSAGVSTNESAEANRARLGARRKQRASSTTSSGFPQGRNSPHPPMALPAVAPQAASLPPGQLRLPPAPPSRSPPPSISRPSVPSPPAQS
ncbi:hypothetical protein EIP91_010794 [Steccherinum ochraceum]|uniref:Uncharacterized protein n=1 Tax=Steccherinum ochraceum TaxID=92696 RepID=A0A4R0R074_9APHY|nr:hypothetical protein EIP91_010794 [Steccherinum ochraceum]